MNVLGWMGELENIACRALAARPPGSDPLVLAVALGFRLLPCPPGTSPELERTTAERLVFAAEPGAEAHADRVTLALARGLLLRDGRPHTPETVTRLARRLRQFP